MAFLTRHVWVSTTIVCAAACALFALALYPRGVDFESRLAHAAERQRVHDLITQATVSLDHFDVASARKLFEQALTIDDDVYQVHLLLGLADYEDGELDSAYTHFDRACSIWKFSPDAHNSRGVILWLKGERKRAMRDFDKALSMNPDFKRAKLNRGLAWLEWGDRDRARLDFEAVLAYEEAQGGQAALASISLGVLDASDNRYAAAERCFSYVFEFDVPIKQREMALFNRARVYDAMGKADLAQRDRDALKQLEQSSAAAASAAPDA